MASVDRREVGGGSTDTQHPSTIQGTQDQPRILASLQGKNSLNRSQGDSLKRAQRAHPKRCGKKVLITRWTNLTQKNRLVLNLLTPELTPPSSPPPSLQPYDDVDFPRKEWGPPGPVEPEYLHESTRLQTVHQLIAKYGDEPNYVVKSKESALQGVSLDDPKKITDGIYEKRRSTKQRPTVKPLEWETEGSGGSFAATSADELIHQLYISLGSIRAGNSS